MSERNNSKVRRPLLVDPDIGSVRRNIHIKNNVDAPDGKIYANNPTPSNNALRLAQAFLGVGDGFQQLGNTEVQEARMDYSERKQAEADAKQAAREAKADAKEAEYKTMIEDRRNAQQFLFEHHSDIFNSIRDRSTELKNADGASQQTHADGMVSMLGELTQGFNQNELDVLQPKFMDMLTNEIDEGYKHFRKINIDIASTGYLTALTTPDMADADKLAYIQNTDAEALDRGLSNDDIFKIRSQAFISQMQNWAQEGNENQIQDFENFLGANGYLDQTDQQEFVLQREINGLQDEARKMRLQKINTAEAETFEQLYPTLKDRDDLQQLEAERNAAASADTDGTNLGLAQRAGKVKAYEMRINELNALTSLYRSPVDVAFEMVDSKMKTAAGDGWEVGESGVVMGTDGQKVFLMGSEYDKLKTDVTNKLAQFGKEQGLSASDPRVMREAYRLIGELGNKWNLGDYNPEGRIRRALNEVDPYYYSNNATLINESVYAKVVAERQTPNDKYRIVNELMPLGDDPEANKGIRRMHIAICNYIAIMDHKARIDEDKKKIAMSESDMANQGGFFVSKETLKAQRERLQALGIDGGLWLSSEYDYETPIEGNQSIFSDIWDWFKDSFTIDSDLEYSFQETVPFTLEQIKQYDQKLTQESGGEKTLKNMPQQEAILIMEQMRAKGEIKALKLVRDLTTEQNVKLKHENEKLKDNKKMLEDALAEDVLSNEKLFVPYDTEPDNALKDIHSISNVLDENKSKNFIKRIMAPDKYPVLNNPDGSYSTHSMSWGEAEDKDGVTSYFVYPTVIQKNGEMVRLSDDDAWRYAIKNKEYVKFESADEASYFSKNYKKYWNSINKHPRKK